MTPEEFIKDRIKIKNQVHLNGGGKFNVTSCGIYCDEVFMGEWCRGRRGREHFSEVMIDDKRFVMPQDRDQLVEAVKNKFIMLGGKL